MQETIRFQNPNPHSYVPNSLIGVGLSEDFC